MPQNTAEESKDMPDWKRWVIFAYLSLGALVCSWKLIEYFPAKPGDAANPVSLFNIRFEGEGRLILIALLAGVVGGFVHIAVSYAQYRATKAMTEEFFAWYLLRPLIGGGLAMAFYAVIRAGFVTPGAGGESAGGAAQILSPYGILAVGLLVGLCNAQAEKKLRSVGQALFDTSKGREDYEDRKNDTAETPTPIVSAIEPQTLTPAVAGKRILIKGSGFHAATVTFDAKPLKVVKQTPSELLCEFAPDAPNVPGGDHKLVVTNGGEKPKPGEPVTVVVAP